MENESVWNCRPPKLEARDSSGRPSKFVMQNQWRHRYAVLLAACTLLLLATGAAFTTNQERPFYSLGQFHPWVGASGGVLAVGLALWIQRADERGWVRHFAWTLAAIWILEGVSSLAPEPWPAGGRIAHALFAQLIFAGTAALAVLTSDAWNTKPEVSPHAALLRFLAKIVPAEVLLQLVLGLGFRHGALGVGPHIIGAFVVEFSILAFAMPVIYGPEDGPLRNLGKWLLSVASAQVFLGLVLFSITPIDIDPSVVVLVALVHAVTAAATFATTVMMAMRILRYVRIPGNGIT